MLENIPNIKFSIKEKIYIVILSLFMMGLPWFRQGKE